MAGLNHEMRTVLVTDADRGSAVAIIRSFNRKGWRVIAASADPLSPGFHSRHTHRSVVYPSPVTAADQFTQTMLHTVQQYGVDLLIPVTDEVIILLAHERQRFEERCQIAMPATHILDVTRNKLRTMELARALDVPTPITVAVETTEEAVACARDLKWPIVLKPAFSRKFDPQSGKIEKYSVSYANDMKTLVESMQAHEGQCPVLLQEYYAGVGQGVELLAYKGQPLAAFQHRRLCEIPVQGGASALRESVPLDPILFEYARCLTEAMNWTGLLMVEFKVGEQGAKLMEINGRVWGSLPLPVASGMDFPGRLADLYVSVPGEIGQRTATDYRLGVQAANPEMLPLWILQVLWGKRRYEFLPFPSRREALPVLVKAFTPRLHYDILSIRDPRPAATLGLRMGRKFLRKLKKPADN